MSHTTQMYLPYSLLGPSERIGKTSAEHLTGKIYIIFMIVHSLCVVIHVYNEIFNIHTCIKKGIGDWGGWIFVF